jgi:hypothetical protein
MQIAADRNMTQTDAKKKEVKNLQRKWKKK